MCTQRPPTAVSTPPPPPLLLRLPRHHVVLLLHSMAIRTEMSTYPFIEVIDSRGFKFNESGKPEVGDVSWKQVNRCI